jgi:DNA-binding IclR family transcriptional regulator
MTQHREINSNRQLVADRPEFDEPTVKSAERVLQIFEFFDDLQSSATVTEITQRLRLPQSSTSALLRSLVTLGYLQYDRFKRTYIPTSRVALLGNWVNEQMVVEGSIIKLMREISEQTNDTILLSVRNKLYIQVIHVIQSTKEGRPQLATGAGRSIVTAGAGHALLSTMSNEEITRIAICSNAQRHGNLPIVSVRDLLDHIAEVRRDGFAFASSVVVPGGGILAMPLATCVAHEPMVVGIAGPVEDILLKREVLVTVMRAAIARWLGTADTGRFVRPPA